MKDLAPTPVKFKEANINLTRPETMTDEECRSLWVYTDGTQCISRWKLTWLQRLMVLFFGHIWLSVYSGYSQPPVWLNCGKTVFIREEK